ncbi:MAG: DUF262 domain-containing HNH endonuclease family protein [Verrucomicrobiota bacterium]|jgi:uncharacterized protein with ParB-like and HNH nuclease domain
MKTPKHSLRKIVTFLNNADEDGGFWLPNIQRPFVWSEEQICRLFDSILRQYPISTLLIWKTKSKIRRRKFIDNFQEEHRHRLTDFYVPEDTKKKCLVLDGQQRLQSLFIGLLGSYDGKELCFDILSGEIAAPDDIKYKFEFLEPDKIQFPWIKFKDLVGSSMTSLTLAQSLISSAGRVLNQPDQNKISEHVSLVFKAFRDDDGIAYQELDSIENPQLYSDDDVVEVFIRANSGGTKLGKSDLLFSLLSSSWDNADDEMEELLDELNRHGFAFNRDFILKTCLTLLGQGARYEVQKFRKDDVRAQIESKWKDIAQAVKDMLDFVRGKTFIRCDKAIPSYLALIPLVYVRYQFPDAWKQARDKDNFLLRSLLTGAFSGTPDQLIDDLVVKLDELKGFDVNEVFGVIRSKGRSLELTEARFWEMGYGSDTIHLLFNLWYRDFNYTPAYDDNFPQIDHIFPQTLLRKVKVANPETGKMNLRKYREADRNQLANCMLLTAVENGAGGKSDIPPEQWFADKSEAYLDMHLIPKDPALWKLEKFEEFIAARKMLIRSKFSPFLVSSAIRNDAT